MTEKIIEITPTPTGSIVTIYPTIEYKAVERRRREAAKRAARLAKVKSHAGGAALIAKQSASRKAWRNSSPLSSSSLSAAPPRAFSTKAPAGFSLPYM